MATGAEEFTASLALETRRLRAEFTELTRVSASFGRTITGAFAGAIIGGRKLSDVLRSLVASLSRQTLSAALRPLGNAIGGQLANLLSPGRIVPFASGGIVRSPTLFGMGGGLGLMGERGAEAILPLARGPDGRLGVQSGGGGAVNVTVHIQTREPPLVTAAVRVRNHELNQPRREILRRMDASGGTPEQRWGAMVGEDIACTVIEVDREEVAQSSVSAFERGRRVAGGAAQTDLPDVDRPLRSFHHPELGLDEPLRPVRASHRGPVGVRRVGDVDVEPIGVLGRVLVPGDGCPAVIAGNDPRPHSVPGFHRHLVKPVDQAALMPLLAADPSRNAPAAAPSMTPLTRKACLARSQFSSTWNRYS